MKPFVFANFHSISKNNIDINKHTDKKYKEW